MTYNDKSYVVCKTYNLNDIVSNNIINEPSIKYSINNLYGHSKEFIKLPNRQKEEAYRVISSLALKFAGIEESYSTTDINGNTYDFEVFSDGNFRIIRMEVFKENNKEVLDERYSKKNS